MLTTRQRIAMQHHCRLPEQTAQPRFYRRNGDLSSGLTLDSGYA
jgi:hypothetical protein